MKKSVEVLVRGIGSIGIAAAKALLADIATTVKLHGFNQVVEGSSCEPGVLNGEFTYEPAEGIAPPAPPAAKPAKAKPAKAKTAPKTTAKKGSKKKKK